MLHVTQFSETADETLHCKLCVLEHKAWVTTIQDSFVWIHTFHCSIVTYRRGVKLTVLPKLPSWGVAVDVRRYKGHYILMSSSVTGPQLLIVVMLWLWQWCDKEKSVLENGSLSDVSLVVSDCTIPAHHVVLASHSSVYRAMFEHNMKESE